MIELKDFTTLTRAEQYLILAWRNDIKITAFVKTKEISFKEHFDFIKALKQEKTKKYFLVYENEEILGVISFVNITPYSCEFGLYQNPHLQGKGKVLMQEILNYAFNILKVLELQSSVLKFNQKALKLYLNLGFYIQKEDEQSFIIKLVKPHRIGKDCKNLNY